ncbi:MAG: diguanylate cyclase [Verrucomicrobiaceae bacterium]|nr:diguanylate cyclase [Verrucomicrobiaceae bacterium]
MVRRLKYGILLGLVILITDAAIPLVISHLVTVKRAEADAAVDVKEQLQLLLSAYQDAETGQRGFMITGQDVFLGPYYKGREALAKLLPAVGPLVSDVAAQTQRWQALQTLTAQHADFQENRISLRRRNESIDIAGAEHGKKLMDGIRAEIAAMGLAEEQSIAKLMGDVRHLQAWSNRSIILVTALDLCLFAYLYWLAITSLRKLEHAQGEQHLLNTQLEQEVRLRSDALERVEWQAARLNEIVLMQGTLAQSQLDAKVLLDQIVHKILNVVPGSGAVVEMIEGEEMVYRATSGSLAEFTGLRLKRLGSLSGQCITENRVLIASDTHTDPRVDRAACEKVGARSMIVAPLMREGQPVGVLKVMAGTADAFEHADVQTLQLMAGYLGATLGHQLQFEKNQLLLGERDITLTALEHELERREEYERQIEGQRQRTETILESSHEAFICIDQHGLVLEWNETAANTFGWSKAEVLDRELTGLILPERHREAHNRGLAHFLQTGEGPVLGKRIELPAQCRDGREIPIEMTISALRIGDGFEFSCFLRDISERKQAEAALLNQQATLRSLTNAIPALVSLVDANERYVYCNEYYQSVFGRAPAELIGTPLRDFLGDALYLECKPHLVKALSGQSVVYERTIQTTTGLHHQECRHVPQFDANGQPSGFYLIAWDVTERKTQEIAWQSRASTDQLTGLMNRDFFIETLSLAIARHRHFGGALAVCYLDVDRFKQINDTYGHAAGDAVLQAFSANLTMSVRQSDTVARLGGDEFCILLDNIHTPENAAAVAQKILAFARLPVNYNEHTLSISTSIGIVFTYEATLDAPELIALADAALYKAKQTGRNRYVIDSVAAQSQTSMLSAGDN